MSSEIKKGKNILSFLALNRFIAKRDKHTNGHTLPSPNVLNVSDRALTKFFKDMNSERIKFLICGSMATAFYGYITPAKQIEIWVSSEGDNIDKLCLLLNIDRDRKNLSSLIWKISTAEGEYFELLIFFDLHFYKRKDFNISYEKCVQAVFKGIQLAILCLDHLIVEKIALGKAEERMAVRELERIQRLST